MFCNSTFIQQLLISACVWLPFQSTALEVEPKNTCVDFNMYAAHYAPKGYNRMGTTGYGEFLGYSFGRTNYCDAAAFEASLGDDKFLCVTNPVVHKSKYFDYAMLCHDTNTRRLFKVVGVRNIPGNTCSADCMEMLESMSRACYCQYKIKIPIPSNDDIDVLLRTGSAGWSIKRDDGVFLISLSLSHKTDKAVQFRMTVESMRARQYPDKHANPTKDIEIDVGDL